MFGDHVRPTRAFHSLDRCRNRPSPGKFMDQVCDEGQDQHSSVLQHLSNSKKKTSWSFNTKWVNLLGASREANPSLQ
jgi:hypothetical protein